MSKHYNPYRRFKKKPSKRRVEKSMDVLKLGIAKKAGTGGEIKGVDIDKTPTVRLEPFNFYRLIESGELLIKLQFTDLNVSMFLTKVVKEVKAESHDFADIRVIRCEVNPPPFQDGLLIALNLKVKKELQNE